MIEWTKSLHFAPKKVLDSPASRQEGLIMPRKEVIKLENRIDNRQAQRASHKLNEDTPRFSLFNECESKPSFLIEAVAEAYMRGLSQIGCPFGSTNLSLLELLQRGEPRL